MSELFVDFNNNAPPARVSSDWWEYIAGENLDMSVDIYALFGNVGGVENILDTVLLPLKLENKPRAFFDYFDRVTDYDGDPDNEYLRFVLDDWRKENIISSITLVKKGSDVHATINRGSTFTYYHIIINEGEC